MLKIKKRNIYMNKTIIKRQAFKTGRKTEATKENHQGIH